MSVQHVMTNHPIVVELFQFGGPPARVTDRQIIIPKAKALV